jgi:hypothetical protein
MAEVQFDSAQVDDLEEMKCFYSQLISNDFNGSFQSMTSFNQRKSKEQENHEIIENIYKSFLHYKYLLNNYLEPVTE